MLFTSNPPTLYIADFNSSQYKVFLCLIVEMESSRTSLALASKVPSKHSLLGQRWPDAVISIGQIQEPTLAQCRFAPMCSVGPTLANSIGPTTVAALGQRWQINATALAQRGQINATALVKYWRTALQELTESPSAHYK